MIRVDRKTALLLVGVLIVAGMMTPASAERGGARCEHPHPCGRVWPPRVEGEGTFELKSVDAIRVESFDGIELDGWAAIPDLPKSVKAPVAVFSGPYWGTCTEFGCPHTPNDPAFWADDASSIGTIDTFNIPPIRLIRQGYALVFVSVRGTGHSGGCFELFGAKEQQDQVEIIRWAAAQPWSNGRVAMGGLSYLAGTAMAGAIKAAEQNVDALKTTVISGVMSDLYTLNHTTQGARYTWNMIAMLLRGPNFSYLPPLGEYGSDVAGSPSDPTALIEGAREWASVLPERTCDEVVRVFTQGHQIPPGRDSEFFGVRRLIDDLPAVTSASLIAHGFDDIAHLTQEDELWRSLPRSPKWVVEGNWGHTFPADTFAAPASLAGPRWWQDSVFAWLGYWLKGRGEQPRLDVVDYQDAEGAWREAGSWPPSGTQEALYLTDARLSDRPSPGSRSFISAPDPREQQILFRIGPSPFRELSGPLLLCGEGAQTIVTFTGDPLDDHAYIAGNPFVYLDVESDAPGGLVGVDLAVVSPEFSCTDDPTRETVELIATGTADLEFHAGNLSPAAFPVGRRTPVRVDLSSVRHRLEPGDRLMVVLSRGDTSYFAVTQGHYPRITVTGGSHVVVPVVEGALGGGEATGPYPPKPFVPARAPI